MQVQAAPPTVSTKAFGSLATLQQLTLEAGLSTDQKQLIFRILNRSIAYCHYDRAALWGLVGSGAKLLGVSGNADVNQRSPLVDEWRRVVGAMPDRDAAAIINQAAFPGQEDLWDDLARRTVGLSVAWLPITVGGRAVAGLWLERWGGKEFSESELAQLEMLALSYGVAWRSVVPRPNRLTKWLSSRRRATAVAVAALLVAALCFVELPLRIVAPCEVVPKDPVAITAPLNGVIDEILVLPGRSVEEGELLAVYDKRVAIEEMKIAQEQLHIVESELRRSQVKAFEDPTARSAIALLKNRLEQEKIRVHIAQYRVDRLEVLAPVSGTVMLDDPHEWRGRPVQIGQRLMMIIDPGKTKLHVRLPDSDNIDFDRDRPVMVILDSDPRNSRLAMLRFVADHSREGKNGMPYFRAEADWCGMEPALKTGLQGTAILYGEQVPLVYWLFRRPFGAVRRYLGI